MKYFLDKETPLLEVLQKLSPDSSKNTLKSWVEKGRVTVDGLAVRHWKKPVKGEVVVGQRVAFAEEGVKVLYEDEHIIVIDKPLGLLSVRTDKEAERTVHSILKRRRQKRVYPVHRLDRETSGVMLFAYTETARDHLKKKFEAHDIEREYMGIVEGILKPKTGTWKSNLIEDANYFMKSRQDGKLAITHYKILKYRKHSTLVSFTLETGRKNQIRVHASEAGHPILGDTKYGSAYSPLGRLCLHAHILGFSHPVTGKKMQFVSPPADIYRS